MKRAYLAITALLVGPGCAMFERKVEYVPYETRVPIPVPCAAALPAEPAWSTRELRRADTLDAKVAGVLSELEQRKGYEEKLKAATDGCR